MELKQAEAVPKAHDDDSNFLEDEQDGGVASGGGSRRQETSGKPSGTTTCSMRPLRDGTIIEVQTTDSERFPNVYAPILPFPFISQG
jgi:hypothetical protein